MKDQLLNHYSNTPKLNLVSRPFINVHNVDGMFIEILGGPQTQYQVKFINKDTSAVVYETVIGSNCWARTTVKFYINWKVEVKDLNSPFTYEYDFDLTDKRVYISLESKSLGDTLAWIPYIEEFRKQHNCILICSTFNNEMFVDQYPYITFTPPTTIVHNIVALYRLGLFYGEDGNVDMQKHPSYPLSKPLQQWASDILGVPYTEIRPKLQHPIVKKDSKLITIGLHSTTQAKYWNNPTGWQEVVDWLLARGYTVKLLSNESDGYMGNKHPTGIIQHPNSTLQSVMEELKKSTLFIGLGSGLSWLSWALEVPTMIISGFSDPISEMQECIRVAAHPRSCNSCFNRTKLDAGDWHWCPDYKNTERQYECSKNITSYAVISKLEKFLDNNILVKEPQGWFAYDDVYDRAVDSAKGGETFVEVGAWLGKSTNYMVSKIQSSGKDIHFTTIDTWKGTYDESYHLDVVQGLGGDIFPEFIKNTVQLNNHRKLDIIKDTSHNAATQFTNNSIDFIMIDAGHSYEDVTADLNTWYHKVKPGGIISGDDYTVFDGVTRAANDYFYNQFETSGYSFIRRKPRIQIKHLLTKPEDLREIVSVESIRQLQRYGMDYQPIVNKPYEGFPPTENCRRPEHLSKDNKPGELYPGAGLGWITGRHYGCYLAHRKALTSINDTDYDYTLIFEADAFIYTELQEFVDIVHKACFISERDDVYHISFANNGSGAKEQITPLFSKTAHHQDFAHCYLVANRHKQWWTDRTQDCEWDVGDLWFNHVFCNHPQRRYTTNKVYSKQTEGMSLLDNTLKTWK